jgi:hypothetical protein
MNVEADGDGIGMVLLDPFAMTWIEEFDARTSVSGVASHAIRGYGTVVMVTCACLCTYEQCIGDMR